MENNQKQIYNNPDNNTSVNGWGYDDAQNNTVNPNQQAALLISDRLGEQLKTPLAMKILGGLLLLNTVLVLLSINSFVQERVFDIEFATLVVVGIIQFLLGIYLLKGSKTALKVYTLIFLIDLSLSFGSLSSPLQFLVVSILGLLIVLSWATQKRH